MRYLDATNFQGSDSDESLLPDEGDSFANEPIPQDSPFKERSGLQVSELIKQKAKDRAIRRLNRPIDKKLTSVGQRAGFSSDALSGLSSDTDENRERLKEEARERAKSYSKDVGKKLDNRIASRGLQTSEKVAGDVGRGARAAQEARAAATAAKGAKTAAATAKGAKAAGTAVKGVQGAIAVAGVASGPETLGLGTIAALLLNIAIGLGISDAIDCLFELKNGNLKQAMFHAIKAIYLIQGFLWLLVALILNISVVGMIVGAPLLLIMNIYMVLGMFFPDVPHLQGLSRKWMMAIILLLDIFVIVMIITVAAGVLYGICTQTVIGSLIGWTGIIGDAINYLDTNYGTGGAVAGLNQACAAVQSFK